MIIPRVSSTHLTTISFDGLTNPNCLNVNLLNNEATSAYKDNINIDPYNGPNNLDNGIRLN